MLSLTQMSLESMVDHYYNSLPTEILNNIFDGLYSIHQHTADLPSEAARAQLLDGRFALVQCSRVNSQWYFSATYILWRDPKFNSINSLVKFLNFLTRALPTIPISCDTTRNLVGHTGRLYLRQLSFSAPSTLWRSATDQALQHYLKDGDLHRLADNVFCATLKQPDQSIFPNITILSLAHCKYLTDTSVIHLIAAHAPTLRDIDLSDCSQLTDLTVKVMAQLCGNQLSRVSLQGCGLITDAALLSLAQHCAGGLRAVDVSYCRRVGDTGIMALVRAKCGCPICGYPMCSTGTQENYWDRADMAAAEITSRQVRMEELKVVGCRAVTRVGLLKIAWHLFWRERQSSGVNLEDNLEEVDKSIGGVHTLEFMVPAPISVRTVHRYHEFSQLVSFFPCNTLRHIHIFNAEFLDSLDLFCLADHIPNIASLTIDGCRSLRDKDLATLLGGLPALTILRIPRSENLTDECLRVIAHSPCAQSLRELDVSEIMQLTDKGLQYMIGIHVRASSVATVTTSSTIVSFLSLVRLNLAYNTKITVHGVVPMVQRLPSLTELDLTNTGEGITIETYHNFWRPPRIPFGLENNLYNNYHLHQPPYNQHFLPTEDHQLRSHLDPCIEDARPRLVARALAERLDLDHNGCGKTKPTEVIYCRIVGQENMEKLRSNEFLQLNYWKPNLLINILYNVFSVKSDIHKWFIPNGWLNEVLGTMATANPLFLLRDFTVHNKPVILIAPDGSHVTKIAHAKTVLFDGASFPRTTLTNLKKSGTTAEFYTLDSLIFLLQHNHLDYTALAKEAVNADIQLVSPIDRKGIIDYLTGHTETNSNIVQDAPTRGCISFQLDKRPLEEISETTRDDNSFKKTRLAPASAKQDDVEFVKKIISRERLVRTKVNILRGTKECCIVRYFIQRHICSYGTQFIHSSPEIEYTNCRSTAAVIRNENFENFVQRDCRSRFDRPITEARIPIIIVPAAATAMLTLHNIKQFLESQIFVDQETARVNGIKKPTRVTIEHKKSNGQILPYHVVDSVKEFKKEDWSHLYPSFCVVKGVYAKWHDVKINDTVAKWNVVALDIHRHKRHTDGSTVSRFWDMLEGYISERKPYLAF
ncbi:hypothetical protein BC937DRAFT_95261 [Endogone sp. FLAS-F59071]|nr:hypothetical protein BC937DRAFT_95261 [Endogone sp. FLAS-F59071]|eukprot:RUS20423.1 hypothetical protein BC937DRAFT_95261 [Endogone sp. FLAS-F59071]